MVSDLPKDSRKNGHDVPGLNSPALVSAAKGGPALPAGGRTTSLLNVPGIRNLLGVFAPHANNNNPTLLDSPFAVSGTPRRIIDSIDKLFATLYQFETEEEFIQPENETVVREAFEEFLKNSGLTLSELSFPILMDEKSGRESFRDDKRTPNWYHELREICSLLSLVRSGILTEKALEEFGGIDTAVTAILRHDSWEDHGKEPSEIGQALKGKIRSYGATHNLSNEDIKPLMKKVDFIENIVDLVSRKIPKRDDDGKLVRNKLNSKIENVDRFDGDYNVYMKRQMENPIAVLVKFLDCIEGVSTRLNVPSFDLMKNMNYAQKIRGLYGQDGVDREAIKAWPQFAEVFRSVDGMLGICLNVLEADNRYSNDRKLKPKNASPISMGRYVDPALKGFSFAPLVCRPDLTSLARIKQMGETNERRKSLYEHHFLASEDVRLLQENVGVPYLPSRTYKFAPDTLPRPGDGNGF